MKLLDVKQLCIDICNGKKRFPVVRNVSYSVNRGEILAVVGESGCGKSISSLAIARLLDEKTTAVKAEHILLNLENESIDILNASKKELRRIRGGGIGYIFQEPAVSLNPVFTVGAQIIESLKLHRKDLKDFNAEAIRLLKSVGISDAEARIKAYPHELSGGMQQRIIIAMALAGNPQLLIADEPTTALDVTIQAQILDLMKDIQKKFGMAIIIITHDLGVVAQICDEVIVMYAGSICEQGSTDEIFYNPQHEYTKGLIRSLPSAKTAGTLLKSISGTPIDLLNMPSGCAFSPRCDEAMKICIKDKPQIIKLNENHQSACWLCVKNLMKNYEDESNCEGGDAL